MDFPTTEVPNRALLQYMEHQEKKRKETEELSQTYLKASEESKLYESTGLNDTV